MKKREYIFRNHITKFEGTNVFYSNSEILILLFRFIGLTSIGTLCLMQIDLNWQNMFTSSFKGTFFKIPYYSEHVGSLLFKIVQLHACLLGEVCLFWGNLQLESTPYPSFRHYLNYIQYNCIKFEFSGILWQNNSVHYEQDWLYSTYAVILKFAWLK